MSLFNQKLVESGTAHLANTDPTLANIIAEVGPLRIEKGKHDDFSALCRIIVSQQLSSKSAETIFNRLQKIAGERNGLTPHFLKNADIQSIKTCGVSNQKTRSMLSVVSQLELQPNIFEEISSMPSEDAVDRLTAIHGIGPWTANIFLLSHLGREDIFPLGDYTLRNTIKTIYEIEDEAIGNVVLTWQPYRSIAARYLWAWADNRLAT